MNELRSSVSNVSTIAANATTGSAVSIAAYWDEVGILVPALTNGATLVLQVSANNATWYNLRDPMGNAVPSWPAGILAGAVGNALALPRGIFTSYDFVRVVATATQTSAVPVLFSFTKKQA